MPARVAYADAVEELKRRRMGDPAAPIDSVAYAAEMNTHYDALDRTLVGKGFPTTSAWWRDQVRRYFESGRRQVVFRVGRRGGKSSTLCRVGVVEALHGRHVVPPGDLGVVAIISVKRDEANQRLRTVKAILDALAVRYHPIDGGIELDGRYVGFKVYTASISGVSGFTGICVICDEVAKWRDADTGANPATEVLASVRPTMATQPNAKIVLSSSPMGRLDAHADAFEAGDDAFQFTAYAPTWLANPTITEADTRALERDERRRQREYGAIPTEENEFSLLSATMLDRATRKKAGDIPPEQGITYVSTMDPGFTKNAWTYCIAAKRIVDGRIKRSVVLHREWRGTSDEPLNSRIILKEIARLQKPYGIASVYTDRYERFGLKERGDEPDIDLNVLLPEWTANERLGAFESLETWMADDEMDIPPDKQLRADLLAIRQKLTRTGFTIELPTTPDGRHCDYAPTYVLAMFKCRVDPDVPLPKPKPGTTAAIQAMTDRLEELATTDESVDWSYGS